MNKAPEITARLSSALADRYKIERPLQLLRSPGPNRTLLHRYELGLLSGPAATVDAPPADETARPACQEDSGMNRRVRLLIIGSLLLPLGCDGPTGLDPSEFCSDHSDAAIATFEDADLEARIRIQLSFFAGPLTCGLVSGLIVLDARSAWITSLVGIQNLTGLTNLLGSVNSISDISVLSGLTTLTLLDLAHNSITDINAVSGLTSLGVLDLDDNSITDVSALSGLTGLGQLVLAHNSITDIGPLSGLTNLGGLGLSNNSITDISALSGLTSLWFLGLNNNSITDISALSGLGGPVNLYIDLSSNPGLSNIQPLLDNTGLGAADTVDLESTNVSCTDVAALQAKGVMVPSDCP